MSVILLTIYWSRSWSDCQPRYWTLDFVTIKMTLVPRAAELPQSCFEERCQEEHQETDCKCPLAGFPSRLCQDEWAGVKSGDMKWQDLMKYWRYLWVNSLSFLLPTCFTALSVCSRFSSSWASAKPPIPLTISHSWDRCFLYSDKGEWFVRLNSCGHRSNSTQ